MPPLTQSNPAAIIAFLRAASDPSRQCTAQSSRDLDVKGPSLAGSTAGKLCTQKSKRQTTIVNWVMPRVRRYPSNRWGLLVILEEGEIAVDSGVVPFANDHIRTGLIQLGVNGSTSAA